MNKIKTTKEIKIKNDWANMGLFWGILSVFFASFGIIPIIGILINTIGIYVSGSMGGKGKWRAIIGLVLSLVYFLVYLYIHGYLKV